MLKVDETIDDAASYRYNAREIWCPMDTTACQKSLFDTLVDGGVNSPATAILNSQWSFRVVRKAH